MNSVPVDHAFYLAAGLLALGAAGLLVRRNLIFMLLSVEVMLNAAGLAFVAAGAERKEATGQVVFLFVLAIAAAEVAVGLALVYRIHRNTLRTDLEGGEEER